MKNEYANVTEKIGCPNVHSQLNKMSEATKEMLLYKTRIRILNEISALEAKFWEASEMESIINPISIDKQIELIHELHEYGFIEETKICLQIIENRINELFQELTSWFRIQKDSFGLTVPNPKKGRKIDAIFLETYSEYKGIFYATFCLAGTQNQNPTWKDVAFSTNDLIFYMEENGYSVLFSDFPNPITGDHLQKEVKNNIAAYILEHTEKLIREYIQEGYELTYL